VLDGGYLSGAEDATVTLGCTVAILDLANDEEMRYTLVHPNEARPAQGKISVASPTGKALLGRAIYEVVEVEAPSGILRYKIEAIEQ
jgi:transcription elongation factor GreA